MVLCQWQGVWGPKGTSLVPVEASMWACDRVEEGAVEVSTGPCSREEFGSAVFQGFELACAPRRMVRALLGPPQLVTPFG